MRMPTSNKEQGNAVIEFIGVTIIFVVPAIFAVIAFSSVISAQYHVASASREAARIFVCARTDGEAEERMEAVIEQMFRGKSNMVYRGAQIDCSSSPCLSSGSQVSVTLEADVSIPYFDMPLHITNTSMMPVDDRRSLG